MRSLRKISIVASLFAVSACSGAGYAIEHYAGVDVKRIQANGEGSRIYDKPTEGRLMITPTIGRAASVGAVQGATLGTSDGNADTMSEFESAADAYVKSRDPNCAVTRGALVINPQYEFFYECD